LKPDKSTHETPAAEPPARRQFLRNALQVGGAVALLMTAASRETFASTLALSPEELDAARRARQAPGAPGTAKPVLSARSNEPSGGCTDCSGSCTGACVSGCTGCKGGCTGTCTGGCSGTSK
jgi:hypothetical protein